MGNGVKPGDWVRFYKNGALVIGVVQYVRVDDTFSFRYHVHTDIGSVWAVEVLEARQVSA